jgi:DNA-binding response OmpR family regulator
MKPHLLIVEDDRDQAEIIARTLKNTGEYDVTVAHDGYTALDVLSENPGIDLVLLDLNLGDDTFDGLTVCSRIRQLPQPPIVIMLTARDQEPDIELGLIRGASRYITKPFSKRILLARVMATLRDRIPEHSEGKIESQREHLIRLHEILAKYFDIEELRTLCFRLGLDYDDLRGEGKQGKARELVVLLDRRGHIAQLVACGNQLRPDLLWDVNKAATPPPTSSP